MLHFLIHILGRGHCVCDVLPKQLAVAFLEPVHHHAHSPFSAFEHWGQLAVWQAGGLANQTGLERIEQLTLAFIVVLGLKTPKHRIQQGKGPLTLK